MVAWVLGSLASLSFMAALAGAQGTADPRTPVIAPAKRTVGALPPPVTPPLYEFVLNQGGGFAVTVKGRTYRIESSYSYPHGGENRLAAGAPDTQGEDSWQVVTQKLDDKTYRMKARGEYYSVERRMELTPSRIIVKDTISNTSDAVVGIILSNHIDTQGNADLKPTMMNKLTAFVHAKDNGVGIIALDDLYQIQERHRFADGLAALRTQDFGLDKGASYTVEWAVYPIASGDYYDFINQVRKDEGLNRCVDGSFAFVPRRKPPDRQFMDRFNLKYTSIGCLGKPPDDPTVSLEGIEFTEYPEECRRLKETFAHTKRMYPGVRVMFHVAHALYACNNPEERFADSRVIKANGKQIMYGGNSPDYYRRYFGTERVANGWRWYIFYPTMENSFGKAMIAATRYMVEELGATGMWADGFMSGYAYVDGNSGGYSYDRWDGHSVDIDPETKLVTAKKTCVSWVALPVLKKVVRIIAAKGGVTITNEGPDYPTPRSLWREAMISSCEGSPGSVMALHLGRAPCPLGSAAPNAQANYQDILKKLHLGALYFWYGQKMDHKTLVEHMYPITIDAIQCGTVRGKERIVTKNSGVLGWPGDRSLHAVYLYDARGYLIRNDVLSTVDASGARTELRLKRDQSAAVVRIPVVLQAAKPINFHIRRYDATTIAAALNGRGRVRVRVNNGDFPVKPGNSYRVTTETVRKVVPGDHNATLAFLLALDGPTTLRIEAAH